MSKIVTTSRTGEQLDELTLEQLFTRAEMFGNVRIHSSKNHRPPACYHCTIEFESIPGTSVTAESEFRRTLPDSLIEAITRAEKIVEKYA
jgi:hypothetical protein